MKSWDRAQIGNTGYVSAYKEEESPLFQKRRVDFGPLPSGIQITHVGAGSNMLVIALSNKHLLRLDTNAPSGDRMDIDLGRRPEDKITSLFVDPTSNHILACVTNARDKQYETLYIAGGTVKPVMLKRFKGYAITAVAWSPDSRRQDRSTREILLGTSNGLVFEAEIDKDAKYFKQVHRVESNSDRQEAVLGLRVDRIKSLKADDNKCFIMVTTPRQSFQFMGAVDPELPIFQTILGNNQNRRYLELPGDISQTALKFPNILAFYAPYPNPPDSFAWMAGCGVSFGYFDFRNPVRHLPAVSAAIPALSSRQTYRPLTALSPATQTLLAGANLVARLPLLTSAEPPLPPCTLVPTRPPRRASTVHIRSKSRSRRS